MFVVGRANERSTLTFRTSTFVDVVYILSNSKSFSRATSLVRIVRSSVWFLRYGRFFRKKIVIHTYVEIGCPLEAGRVFPSSRFPVKTEAGFERLASVRDT